MKELVQIENRPVQELVQIEDRPVQELVGGVRGFKLEATRAEDRAGHGGGAGFFDTAVPVRAPA